ncbi:hypothetical protein BJF78_26340 [Pseudonocardia sp. CNS-139]|nr:hypothetical protein BJF78_26340 [Pseudonocardia sp. CNS-139]
MSTHCTTSTGIPRSAWIEGTAVSTIVESRTTMKNAAPSRVSAHQRRGSGGAAVPGSVRSMRVPTPRPRGNSSA